LKYFKNWEIIFDQNYVGNSNEKFTNRQVYTGKSLSSTVTIEDRDWPVLKKS